VDHTENNRPKKHKDKTDSQKLDFPNHGLLHVSSDAPMLPQPEKFGKPESTLDSRNVILTFPRIARVDCGKIVSRLHE
jgi:hypothetical protein